MTDDDRDFVDRAESMTKNLYGRSMTTADIANNFALFGLKKRAETLDGLDAELRGEIDSSPQNLRRRARLTVLRKQLDGVHEALRKARR